MYAKKYFPVAAFFTFSVPGRKGKFTWDREREISLVSK